MSDKLSNCEFYDELFIKVMSCVFVYFCDELSIFVMSCLFVCFCDELSNCLFLR